MITALPGLGAAGLAVLAQRQWVWTDKPSFAVKRPGASPVSSSASTCDNGLDSEPVRLGGSDRTYNK